MKNINKKKWLISLALFLTLFTQFSFIKDVNAECKEKDGKICLNASFDNKKELDIKGKDAVGIIRIYLEPIFKFAAGFIIVIAVIMIIIGGYETMIKGGIEGNIAGKERIIQALLGLILVFLSALILHAINPNFFKLGDVETTKTSYLEDSFYNIG